MITAVIPARMASSRFPGKPLVSILGLPMVEHVRRRALLAPSVHHVIVATCDESVREAVESAGGRAVMTADTHTRCTDRVHEAMQSLPGDIVVIVQGDEPLIDPDAIERVVQPLVDDPEVQCTNLVSPFAGEADRSNPDIVKAVCALSGDIIYLTRASVPHFREQGTVPVYRQTGIMAFRTGMLQQFADWPETPLERAESVDMMRIVEHGGRIRGVLVEASTAGVDRPEDVGAVEQLARSQPLQRELLAKTGAEQ